MRRLTVRDERRADIHQAFLTLGCCLICCNALPEGFLELLDYAAIAAAALSELVRRQTAILA